MKDIQERYSILIREKDELDKVQQLYDATEVRPSIPKDEVQKRYSDYLIKGKLSSFVILQEATGIPPDKNIYRLLL